METDLEKVINDVSLDLSPADVKAYMRMLLEALDFCHRNGIMHRDVKPNNLLRSSEGTQRTETHASPNTSCAKKDASLAPACKCLS